VAGCWLVRHGYGVGEGVFSLLVRLRRNKPDGWKPSPETAAQEEIVRSWPNLRRYQTLWAGLSKA